jgi:glycine cleavage system regulatory protein
MVSLILALVGPDRPGLVSRLSEQVAQHGGSWLGSRMAHLAGQFAGIVQVGIPEAEQSAFTAALSQLESDGFRLLVQSGGTEEPAEHRIALHLELIGHDRPGIIRDITQILANRGVNIEDLTSDVVSGSFSGEVLFRAEARLFGPVDLTVEEIRRDLERIGNELMVDIKVTERPSHLVEPL